MNHVPLLSRFLRLISAVFPVFFMTSCGYHLGQGGLISSYHTVSVPYVIGDLDGSLTAAVIRQLSASSELEVRNQEGSLLLKIAIIDFGDENIGFRYDRNHEGEVTHSIIPTETRITEICEITVIESCSGKVLLGPVRIAASVDFDHDYYKSRNGINIFSLGQLNDYDAAHDDVYGPLNQALAKKIVDYVSSSW
jgi:hypothetical protein